MYAFERSDLPSHYSDMIYRFGRPVPLLSIVTNQVLDYIYNVHHHRVTQWNDQILNPVALQSYADSISRKEAALESCFGFVDRTVFPICRSKEKQTVVYSGHKRVHSLNLHCYFSKWTDCEHVRSCRYVTEPLKEVGFVCFERVRKKNLKTLIPNFEKEITKFLLRCYSCSNIFKYMLLLLLLFLFVQGKTHDAGMLAESSLLNNLELYAISTTGQPMCLYGDPAYPLRVHLHAPFKDIRLMPDMEAFNQSMSSVRISVEWIPGESRDYESSVS